MAILTFGTLITSISIGPANNYYLLLVGRGEFVSFASNLQTLTLAHQKKGIYGVGVESLYIALDAIITVWWDGKLLSLAFGLENAAGRLGEIFGYGILFQLFIILYLHISLNSSFFFEKTYTHFKAWLC